MLKNNEIFGKEILEGNWYLSLRLYKIFIIIMFKIIFKGGCWDGDIKYKCINKFANER